MSLIDWLIPDTIEFLADEIKRSRVWRKRHYNASHRRVTYPRKRAPEPPIDKMPTDRGIAFIKGDRFYFDGKKCHRGHLTARYTTSGNCVTCSRESARRTSHKRTQEGR